MEIKNVCGDVIRRKYNLSVNLTRPDLPIHVDIRKKFAFVYNQKIEGAGGLPLGIQGKAISLMSGGPDSTLATWLAMKRGLYIIGVYFDFGEKNLSIQAVNRVLKIGEKLAKDWRGLRKLYIVPFTKIVTAILTVSTPKNAYVLLKRYMMRFAREIARREKANAIVTGEILGEHASQTLDNLLVISDAISDLIILRPVLTYDKSEIFRNLKKIDEELYELSSKSIEPCRDIASIKPTTKAKIQQILSDEKKLGIDEEIISNFIDDAVIIEY